MREIPRPQLLVMKKEGRRSRLNRRSRANVIVYRTLDGQSETIAGGYGAYFGNFYAMMVA